MDKDINRIKVVLVEKKGNYKRLAEQLGCTPTSISKWCTNDCQPTLETFLRIADLLDVELTELVKTKKSQMETPLETSYSPEETKSLDLLMDGALSFCKQQGIDICDFALEICKELHGDIFAEKEVA